MSFSMTGRPFGRMSAAAATRSPRRMRRPQHQFYAHFLPMDLQPVAFVPVLPGETLKNILFQARVMTTPLVNRITGWWIETYWFYVRASILDKVAASMNFAPSMIDLGQTLGVEAADLTQFGSKNGDSRAARYAYIACVNEFFRDDDEAISSATTSLVQARLRQPGWWDSILPKSYLDTISGGIADDVIGDTVSGALDQVGEVARALETYRMLREMGVTNLEYDDWLRSFGVSIAAPTEERVELLRYTKEWQYPSSTVNVDATTQRVSAVASWSLTERADKDRYFREPGLLVAMVLARPKVYHDRQQSGVGHLLTAVDWQTPFGGLDGYERYRDVLGMTGYQFDSRDLFIHGDQYRYAVRGTAVPAYAWPSDGKHDYLSAAEVNALFTDGASGYVMIEGVASLQVASSVIGPDETPRTT